MSQVNQPAQRTPLDFGVLGHLLVRREGLEVVVTTSMLRALLATLLCRPNRPVDRGTLMTALWQDEPPRSANKTLSIYVHRLRKVLGPGRLAAVAGVGYRMCLDGSELDAAEFARLTADSAAARQRADVVRASSLAVQALALWRGPAFAGVEGNDLVRVEGARLEEMRLSTIEDWAEMELELHRHSQIASVLVPVVAENPYRERLTGILMLALYRTGRQAQALEIYQDTYRLFLSELGIRPGPQLQQLHQRILQEDQALLSPRSSSVATRSAPPAQLPTAVRDFTGRAAALAQLDSLLADHHEPNGAPVVISAIAGTGGVGKTALAVHWAHRVRDRFPDGQLYVNLRGFDPTGIIVSPAEAIRRFLHALAVPAQRVPADLDGQVDLYRTLLAGKRMLVVLDNARDPDQVRPLLPGTPSCLVLITSRNKLTSLVAAEGAQPLSLDLLTQEESRDFLTRRLGRARVMADPEATGEIIFRSAGLPLALAIVAAHAASDPQLPLQDLAGRLRHSHDRLDTLSTGDAAATDMRTVFSLSYRTLGREAADLFRLLGLHPGPDFSPAAVSSLAAVPADQVRTLLAELADAHLIEQDGHGRYSFHDLLRTYAAELARAALHHEQHREATNRMLDHYLHTANAGAQLITPARTMVSLMQPRPGVDPEPFAEHEQALQWFYTERPVLLATVSYAAANGFDTHTWQLVWALAPFLDLQILWQDEIALHHAAIAAAERQGDEAAQSYAYRNLARAHTRRGELAEADKYLLRALGHAERIGDPSARANIYLNLGHVLERQGRHQDALDHSRQALELFRVAGYAFGQANALSAIGWCLSMLAEYQQALDYCQQALAILQEVGDRHIQANTWDTLGYLHRQLGDHAQALICYQHAIDLVQDLGARHKAADYLTHLGDAHHAVDNNIAARLAWEQAISIFDQLDHPDADTVRAKLGSLTS
jgi:DNA-binding SARP family transcriptional activator/tetratricopeptide (TPR) repeat protein